MPHILSTRIGETTTTTGTGAVTLAGAITAHRTFASVCAVSDTTEYGIVAVDGSGVPTGDWEEGVGTYSGASTLTRTTVTASSNAGAEVNFAAGTKVVFITPRALRVRAIPLGGSTDQVLAKNSGTDLDLKWTTAASGGGGFDPFLLMGA